MPATARSRLTAASTCVSFLAPRWRSPGLCGDFWASLGTKGRRDVVKTWRAAQPGSLHVSPLFPKDDLVRDQRRPQVVVHRWIVEGHCQHVEHRSDLAADDFDARMRADHRRHGLMDRTPGLSHVSISRILAGHSQVGRPAVKFYLKSGHRPVKFAPAILLVLNRFQDYGQAPDNSLPLRRMGGSWAGFAPERAHFRLWTGGRR